MLKFISKKESLQELEIPSTPEAERKSFENEKNMKNKEKKKKRKESVMDNDSPDDHRKFETLEELRTRLKKNYEEAKMQREKYLNLKNENTKEDLEEKSINGDRNKAKKPNIFKNYKQASVKNTDSSQFKRKNSYKKKTSSSNISASDSFSAELSSAIIKYSSSGSSLPTSTPRSASMHSMKSDNAQTSTPRSASSYSIKSDLEVISQNENELALSNGNKTIVVTSSELSRKNSRKKRSNSRSSSLQRKNSQKGSKPAPINNNNDVTLESKTSVHEDLANEQSPESLGNVMDMLANW